MLLQQHKNSEARPMPSQAQTSSHKSTWPIVYGELYRFAKNTCSLSRPLSALHRPSQAMRKLWFADASTCATALIPRRLRTGEQRRDEFTPHREQCENSCLHGIREHQVKRISFTDTQTTKGTTENTQHNEKNKGKLCAYVHQLRDGSTHAFHALAWVLRFVAVLP